MYIWVLVVGLGTASRLRSIMDIVDQLIDSESEIRTYF